MWTIIIVEVSTGCRSDDNSLNRTEQFCRQRPGNLELSTSSSALYEVNYKVKTIISTVLFDQNDFYVMLSTTCYSDSYTLFIKLIFACLFQ